MKKFLYKIRLNLKNGTSRRVMLCNTTLYQYDINFDKNGERYINIYYPSNEKLKSYSDDKQNKRVFYLKVNRIKPYTFWCIQQWINIINILNADFYFICDNSELEKNILQKIQFKNKNIKFLKSEIKRLDEYVDLITKPCWRKACYAHLTTLLHAKDNNIEQFWNIDADDTMLLMSPNKAVRMILEAEQKAKLNKINALSFDMWYSLSYGEHWSFGISYISNKIDWFKLMNPLQNADWKQTISSKNYNIDWYFTYLRNNGQNIQTFYVDNSSFIHWGNFEYDKLFSNISKWQNGKLSYPISKYLYNENFAERIIPKDCIKFDIGIEDKDAQWFINTLLLTKYLKEG